MNKEKTTIEQKNLVEKIKNLIKNSTTSLIEEKKDFYIEINTCLYKLLNKELAEIQIDKNNQDLQILSLTDNQLKLLRIAKDYIIENEKTLKKKKYSGGGVFLGKGLCWEKSDL